MCILKSDEFHVANNLHFMMSMSLCCILLCQQMVNFFTSANGEDGSTPVHPEVLSGDTRREMQLQGWFFHTSAHSSSSTTDIQHYYLHCSVCEQRPVDRVWYSLGDKVPGQLHCSQEGRECAWTFLHPLLHPRSPVG